MQTVKTEQKVSLELKGDLEMGLPKQVEQDLADLEAYEKSLAAPVAPAASETPPADPPAASPEQPPASPAQSEPPAAPVEPPKPDAWEHKYRTLEGKYRAEVPTLHEQLRTQAAQLLDVQAQLEALKKPQVPEPQEAPLVTDKDVTEYGAELIDVQRRVAREVIREQVAPLRDELKKRDAELAALKQALGKTDGAVVTMSFEQRLAQAVPDFSQINADPKWIAYLDEPDPYTGEPRRAFAEFAYNNGNVDKVKQVVSHFKATVGQAPAQTDEAAERARLNAELERQITPNRANSQAAPAQPASTRVYTEAEMVHLFNVVRQLNTQNKQAEASKLEAELSEAYMTGRVRG